MYIKVKSLNFKKWKTQIKIKNFYIFKLIFKQKQRFYKIFRKHIEKLVRFLHTSTIFPEGNASILLCKIRWFKGIFIFKSTMNLIPVNLWKCGKYEENHEPPYFSGHRHFCTQHIYKMMCVHENLDIPRWTPMIGDNFLIFPLIGSFSLTCQCIRHFSIDHYFFSNMTLKTM